MVQARQDEVATNVLSETKLLDLFRQVSDAAGRKPSEDDNEATTSDQDKLRLYGLYSRVNDRNLPSSKAPSIFQPVARAKFWARKECSSMTKRDAMNEYIQMIASRQDTIGEECRRLLNEQNEFQARPPTQEEHGMQDGH